MGGIIPKLFHIDKNNEQQNIGGKLIKSTGVIFQLSMKTNERNLVGKEKREDKQMIMKQKNQKAHRLQQGPVTTHCQQISFSIRK